jgi:biopolymer transport protein ExbD
MKLNWKFILIIILAFIVVSAAYFVLTTTLSSPTVMELKIPKDRAGANAYQNTDKKLTLVLLKNNMFYGYFGNDITGGSNFEIQKAQNIILEGIKKFTIDSLVILIKPAKEAPYNSTIEILDQMTANRVEKYLMTDPDKKEKEFLKIDESNCCSTSERTRQ